jgi:hypothetical protein
VLPKFTVLRLLIFIAFITACIYVQEGLPSPIRAGATFVVVFGGARMLQYWARRDRDEDGSAPEDFLEAPDGPPPDVEVGRRVWRVRLWVRLLSVAIPLLGLPFVLQPQLFNPDWETGVPTSDLVFEVLFYAVLGMAVWAAFRSRLDVDETVVRVVNPWRVHSFPRAEIRSARSGPWGLELVLADGRVIVVFAVQCVGGRRPRWVEVARTITGHAAGERQ